MLKLKRSKWIMEYVEAEDVYYAGNSYDETVVGLFESMQEVINAVSERLKEDVRAMLLNVFEEPGSYTIVTTGIEENEINYGTEELVAYITKDDWFLGYHVFRVNEEES